MSLKSNFKKIINGNLAGFIFSILSYSLSGYLYGVEEFAAFSVAMSITAPLAMLCSLKIDAKVLSEIYDKDGVVWLNFAIRVVPALAFLSTVITGFSLYMVDFSFKISLNNGLIVWIYVTLCALSAIQKSVLIRLDLFNVIKWGSYISGAMTSIGIALAATADTGWAGIVSGFSCGQFLGFIYGQKKIGDLIKFTKPNINYKDKFKNLKIYFLTLNLTSVIDSFAVGFPVLFLAKIGASETLAIYYLCQKLIYGPMSLVVSSVSMVLTRLMQELNAAKQRVIIKKTTILKLCSLSIVGYISLLIFNSIFEGEINSDYALIVDISLILFPSFVLKSIGSGLSAGLVVSGNVREIAFWQLLNAALSFFVYYIFSKEITGFQFLIVVSIFESVLYSFYGLLSIRAVKKSFCIG